MTSNMTSNPVIQWTTGKVGEHPLRTILAIWAVYAARRGFLTLRGVGLPYSPVRVSK
jgi:hypothetical protein